MLMLICVGNIGAGMCNVDPNYPTFQDNMGSETASQYLSPSGRALWVSGSGLTSGNWTQGGTITVTIVTPTSSGFKGLLIYAHDNKGNKIGSFNANNYFQEMVRCILLHHITNLM
jgi:hypothetical protein